MSLSGSPDQHQRLREVKQGDHICALFVNPAERDVMLHGYVLAGLQRGHKCVIVFDESDSGPLVTTLRQHCAVDAHLASGQLELRRASDTAPPQGWLAVDDMLGLWTGPAMQALDADGYPFVRFGGEATWARRHVANLDDLIYYESRLNRYAISSAQSFLCLYDLSTFGGAVVVDLLHTHPKLLLSGVELENPYYLEPDEFLAFRQARS
jgi:hypothetical protein